MGKPDDGSFGSWPASAGMTPQGVSVSEVHGCAGNGRTWKDPAPARCFGTVGTCPQGCERSWGPAFVRRPLRWEEPRRKVQGRTCRRSLGFASAGHKAGDAGFGRASNRMVGGFGRPQSPADDWVRAQSRGKPKGASGLYVAATRSVGNGLPAEQPLRWRRLSESGQVSAGAWEGRRVNHERGWTPVNAPAMAR